MNKIINPFRSLEQRYDDFCEDAEELLEVAGLARPEQTPIIVGRAFLDACNALADMNFPEDKQVAGLGPRGTIWSMYSAVENSDARKTVCDPVSGARSIAIVLKKIIKYRPPLDQVNKADYHERLYYNINGNAALESDKKVDDKLCFVISPSSQNNGVNYLDTIKLTIANEGYRIAQTALNNINEDYFPHIISKIEQAKLIIADISTMDSQSYFELGAAIMSQKKIIYICKHKTKMGFTIPTSKVIIYSDSDDLKEKLCKKIISTVGKGRK